jgi:uncharacterized membrane protein YdjX (TVP38/TMEM64 family)
MKASPEVAMTTSEAKPSGHRTWLRLAAFAAAALAAVLLVRATGLGEGAASGLQALLRWVPTLGPWGPVAFIVGYVLATVAFVPGSVLTLAAGAIFGLGPGTLYVFCAASLGACAAFALSRTVARGAIERRLEGNLRFAAIDRAIAAEGRKIAFLLRLSPVFPFSLLNYALGLTRVRFVDYAFACLGMLPGTLLYVYLGSLAGDAAGRGTGERTQLEWLFRAAGLVVTLVVTLVITRTARRALREVTGDEAST